MTETWQLNWSADIVCTDGPGGEFYRLILDPVKWSLTYLIAESHHLLGTGRLVPVTLVRAVTDRIELSCTAAQFSGLQPAEDRLPGGLPPGRSVAWTAGADHNVPAGGIEIVREETIQAKNGYGGIGRLHGLSVDANDFTVTNLIVTIGHFLHPRQVTVPFATLESVDEFGMHLSYPKEQIEQLPSVP